MSNELGKVRQSAVLMNYGPGAIIDFRVPGTGAAVSVVAGGLEEWEKQADDAGLSINDLKRLTEPRLREKLNVKYFRLPPVAVDKKNDDDEDDETIPLAGARFPTWLQCPQCNVLKPARKWGTVKQGDPSRYCAKCSEGRPDDDQVFVVPSRFVLACRNGHLDEFPWSYWVHRGREGCRNVKEFVLKHEGAGLAGMILSCAKCQSRRSMEQIFRKEAFEGFHCSGARPWLADADQEDCRQTPTVMQRGASNLYFPQLASALVIPPWSEQLVRAVGQEWDRLKNIESQTERHSYIEKYLWDDLDPRIQNLGLKEFCNVIDLKIDEADRMTSGNLRWDEYQQFRVAATQRTRDGDEFSVRVEAVSETLPHLSSLIRVVSIREIRAIKSFSRVEAPPGRPPVLTQFLSKYPRDWLPAIDVRGEGIFFSLDEERLSHWEQQPAVQERAGQIVDPQFSRLLNPDGDIEHVPASTVARYLLLHSLAHILIKQLSLQCGYSSASLRERIYVGDGDQTMAGILIYTATSDSDGTLGGLQRQGDSRRFAEMFKEAVRANEWCSSDPLCIKGLVATSESSSLAACHSCLLVPETSCEDYNRFLDRGMLYGTPEEPSIGFFRDLIGRAEED